MGDAFLWASGNQGDAVKWGEPAREARHLSAIKATVGRDAAHILITWAAIMEGGFQVNTQGRRFHYESLGYSGSRRASAAPARRHCVRYLRSTHRGRGAGNSRTSQCREAGALIVADSIGHWQRASASRRTRCASDSKPSEFGKPDRSAGLRQETCRAILRLQGHGALFHTPGRACDRRAGAGAAPKRQAVPNLFAAAAPRSACPVPSSGYLSGNGLLTATVFGRIAAIGRET